MPTVRFEREHHRAIRQALQFTRATLIAADETFLGAGCTDSTLCVDLLAELEERMRAELTCDTVDRIRAYGHTEGNVVRLERAPW